MTRHWSYILNQETHDASSKMIPSCARFRASPLFRLSTSSRPHLPPVAHSSATFAHMASTLPNSSIFKTLSQHDPNSLAVVHSQSGRSFTYGSLIHDVAAAKDDIWTRAGKKSLSGERVAFLAENGYDYVGEQPNGKSGMHS